MNKANKIKKIKKTSIEATIEKTLWDAACKLIGTTMPINYMNICLGLIFLKYVSDRFEIRYMQLMEDGHGFENEKDAYAEENVFWVPENSRWSNLSKLSKTEEIGTKLDQALLDIEKDNPELKGILPKVYSSPDIEKRLIGELVDLFTNQLPTEDMKGDLFGKCYEFFMGEFSKKFGQKGGEFFTPRCIVDLIVNMIQPYNGRVYDPCCGSGGMFTQSIKFINNHQGNINNISIYGQERNPDTWRLAKMNLAIRSITANLGNSFGDTFHDDQHKTLRADFIMANPPFNISDYGQSLISNDHRWTSITGELLIPPNGNANYAWIMHMISKLSPNGIAGFVLANGSLSTNGKEEYLIRKAMLEYNGGIVDCIITLPTKLFSTVGIPACLWFIRKNKTNKNKVLLIDCKDKGTLLNKRIRELTQDDIVSISDTYHNWLKNENYIDVKGYCKSVTIEEIQATNYSLVPGRYVGIDDSNKLSEEEVKEEIKKVKKELKELMEKSKELDEKILSILNSDD